jgi:uncharacterized protein YbjT (DUF2867 family)
VRDPAGAKAAALASEGAALFKGDLSDRASIEAAMEGVHGVFSVQPSSGQGAAYGVSDEDEVRFGKSIADIALASGVRHLVYSSANAAGSTPSGMGHFDSKSEIEAHIRGLSIVSTIVRPSAFMEILVLPGMGLDQGKFTFLMRPDQKIQVIAADDIGRIVAEIFSAPETHGGRTIEIAGDALTGDELAARFSHAAGAPIRYERFADSLLEQNPFLAKLAALIDDGRLAGHADISALRLEFGDLLTFEHWLEGPGRPLLLAAMKAEGGSVALR